MVAPTLRPVPDSPLRAVGLVRVSKVAGRDELLSPDLQRTAISDHAEIVGLARYLPIMCSIPGCARRAKQRGWCSTHYFRWYRHGDANWQPPNLSERFWRRVDRSGDCWIWTGAKAPSGYGRCTGNPRGSTLAHVFAWEDSTGREKPPTMELDHLCRNIACVRPDHLELVPPAENRRRQQAVKTHCPSGHPYSGDNLYTQHDSDGRRIARKCRQCRRDGMRRSR